MPALGRCLNRCTRVGSIKFPKSGGVLFSQEVIFTVRLATLGA